MEIDKSKEITSSIKLVNNSLHYEGLVDGNNKISIDYIPPFGDNLGYTSLELLLLSLSSCVGSAMLLFLRRMQKTISGFENFAKGERNENHPTGFKCTVLNVQLKSPDINEADLEKVVALAEEKYCPVWSMIKGNVESNFDYTIFR